MMTSRLAFAVSRPKLARFLASAPTPKAKKLLVIHGLGLDKRGYVEVEKFGTTTLADYNAAIDRWSAEVQRLFVCGSPRSFYMAIMVCHSMRGCMVPVQSRIGGSFLGAGRVLPSRFLQPVSGTSCDGNGLNHKTVESNFLFVKRCCRTLCPSKRFSPMT